MFELDKTLDSTHLSILVSSLVGFCYHMILCLVQKAGRVISVLGLYA